MVGNRENLIFSQTVNSHCNSVGLPRNGKIEKGDFVCWIKGNAWIYFMKPKNPGQIPKTSHDGEPKFVKSMSDVRNFGINNLQEYLEILATRNETTVRRVNKANKNEEIWQFC